MVSKDRLLEHGEPCSLTVHFLTKVKEFSFTAHAFTLYEDLITGFDDLLDRAHVDTPSLAAQRLRAFYCLEVLYHLLLPRVMLVNPGTMREPFSMVFRKGVPRTREGLETLLESLEEVNRFVVVGATEMDMVGVKSDSTRPDASALRRGSMGQIALIASYAIEVATHVRSSLTMNDLRQCLGMVGLTFAEALDAIKESPTQCMNYGVTLLNISEETGISPWDQKQQG